MNDMAILSYDVGSMPFPGDLKSQRQFEEKGRRYGNLTDYLFDNDYSDFESAVISGFIGKLNAGVDVPNYPQYRDMNTMFLERLEGVEKRGSGYIAYRDPKISKNKAKIPEVEMIRQKASYIADEIGHRFSMKICVTGPYTLAAMFSFRTSDLYEQLGRAISEFVEANLFSNKYGEVGLVAMDEPTLGFMSDDATVDYGNAGREALIRGWEHITDRAKGNAVKTIMHLHNTSLDFFWDVRDLDVIESHVDDPIYNTGQTKKLLEEHTKWLKVPIAVTQFDDLIMSSGIPHDEIGFIYDRIKRGDADPIKFIESERTMRDRKEKALVDFGDNYVLYGGPECGLSSHPTVDSANELLRRAAAACR